VQEIAFLIEGTSRQRLGQVIPYDDVADQGRFEVTKNAGDKNVFKVPSLRNIDKTGPYFHNGRFETLEEVVQVMAKHQLGKTLQGEEVASVITFLKTLTGDLPLEYIKEPTLPKSGRKTPKPDPR
jgi:cytochrome c peroxidase